MAAAIWLFIVAVGAGSTVADAPPATGDTSRAAPKVTLDAPSEAALRERALRWWNARVKRDHQTMYDLHEPAYRAKVSFGEFITESSTRSRFDLSSPEIKEITAETDARAKVVVEFRGLVPILGQAVTSRLENTWVKVDGEWFKVHDPTPTSILPPPKQP